MEKEGRPPPKDHRIRNQETVKSFFFLFLSRDSVERKKTTDRMKSIVKRTNEEEQKGVAREREPKKRVKKACAEVERFSTNEKLKKEEHKQVSFIQNRRRCRRIPPSIVFSLSFNA
jgi:hypothetical protein